jgi:CTP:molybdopterin cytidylyltransferase MocA
MVVVLGPPHAQVTRAEAERNGIPWVENPHPEVGMGSSVAIGFAHAQRCFTDVEAALLWPVDHARVGIATIRTLIADRALVSTCQVLVPRYRDRGGHPVLVMRSMWPALANCTDAPQGARSVFRAHASGVSWLDCDDPGVIADVDSAMDLQ